MPAYRKTAIVTLTLPGYGIEERLPLTWEREYGITIRIGDQDYPAQNFRSPRNDEQWREFVRRLRECNTNRSADGHRGAIQIRSIGRDLYQALAGLSPRIEEFLRDYGTPRRLVIQSRRPEIHTLPWGALYDTDGKFLAAGDLSIVESWENFRIVPETTKAQLNLRTDWGTGTNRSTSNAVTGLPPEIQQDPEGPADILHVEAHGNAVTGEIGDAAAWALAQSAKKVTIALLWSCYSAAGNSWGESPALCLHREGAGFVLSFQAELHNLDAAGISLALYRDVFGPKASRDLESAVVRIRSARFEEEFDYAAWASMTVYLRNPLDMSAMPLNGPRVPKSGWNEASPGPEWDKVVAGLSNLKPGSRLGVYAPQPDVLPDGLLLNWKGTVVRIDGGRAPLPQSTLTEMDLDEQQAPQSHPADRLVWFFEKIAHYGAPLIVWSNADPRYLDFLKMVAPSPTLTFLLLYGPAGPLTLIDLVDQNFLEEARQKTDWKATDAGDEYWQAAYMAHARGEVQEDVLKCFNDLTSESEKLLMSGNFVSRFRKAPGSKGPELTVSERWQVEETFYKDALSKASAEKNARDVGRASVELGYMLAQRGEIAAAEQSYRAALENLERVSDADSRWHSALGRVLRDYADLLSTQPGRLEEASTLLKRALAIHSFHGRALQIAYSQITAARIALTGGNCASAVENAVDAANTFESCAVWRGWGEPVLILLDALMEMGQTERMLAVADLAIQKIAKSNLPPKRVADLQVQFGFKKAEALWAAGHLAPARSQLESLGPVGDAQLRLKVERLLQFLTV